jgi:ABC-2 type transport system permease protein
MIALFRKEISVFFGTLIGYLIIAIFLLVNSIILWYSGSQFSVIENGYANMDMFFIVSPMLFLLFIPAISMRIFAEEYNSGTIEILLTKPISVIQIIVAKYLAVLVLVCLSIFPTIIYVISIYYLGETIGNLDLASIFGSYLGLIFLSSVFSSVSVFSSALSSSQIISFIISIFLCVLFYFGFDLLSELSFLHSFDLLIQKVGISYHYQNLSKGLLRLTDFVYFLSVSFLFLKLNEQLILSRKE